jgi:hypothetical protein
MIEVEDTEGLKKQAEAEKAKAEEDLAAATAAQKEKLLEKMTDLEKAKVKKADAKAKAFEARDKIMSSMYGDDWGKVEDDIFEPEEEDEKKKPERVPRIKSIKTNYVQGMTILFT